MMTMSKGSAPRRETARWSICSRCMARHQGTALRAISPQGRRERDRRQTEHESERPEPHRPRLALGFVVHLLTRLRIHRPRYVVPMGTAIHTAYNANSIPRRLCVLGLFAASMNASTGMAIMVPMPKAIGWTRVSAPKSMPRIARLRAIHCAPCSHAPATSGNIGEIPCGARGKPIRYEATNTEIAHAIRPTTKDTMRMGHRMPALGEDSSAMNDGINPRSQPRSSRLLKTA
jgi:hypothetical protein